MRKERARSGEEDEHHLWKHLTKEKKPSGSSAMSVEFVPNIPEEDSRSSIVFV